MGIPCFGLKTQGTHRSIWYVSVLRMLQNRLMFVFMRNWRTKPPHNSELSSAELKIIRCVSGWHSRA